MDQENNSKQNPNLPKLNEGNLKLRKIRALEQKLKGILHDVEIIYYYFCFLEMFYKSVF